MDSAKEVFDALVKGLQDSKEIVGEVRRTTKPNPSGTRDTVAVDLKGKRTFELSITYHTPSDGDEQRKIGLHPRDGFCYMSFDTYKQSANSDMAKPKLIQFGTLLKWSENRPLRPNAPGLGELEDRMQKDLDQQKKKEK